MGKKKGGGGKHKGGGKAAKAQKSSSSNSNSSAEPEAASVPTRHQPARTCKKKSKENAGFDYEEYYSAFGLKIRKMMGDGNCLFRAFADQVEGSESNHSLYRTKIVQHVTDHKDEYAIFHEQEEEKTFDERLKKLKKNGTYGGQESLVAFARVFKRVVFVHQPDEKITLQLPPWPDVDSSRFKQVHILYTGGNHYDSIRFVNDNQNSKSANVLLLSDTEKDQVTYVKDSRKLEDISVGSLSPVNNTDDEKDSGVDSESLDGSTGPSSRLSEPSESEGAFENDQVITPDVETDSTLLPVVSSVEDSSSDINLENPSILPSALSEPSGILSSVPVEIICEASHEETKQEKRKNISTPAKEKALSKKEKRARQKKEKAHTHNTEAEIPNPVADMNMVEKAMAAMRMVTV